MENTTEFEGFHGVNERIRVDEYGRSIGFFYQLMDNLDNLREHLIARDSSVIAMPNTQ
ncbi:hypothetical protein ACO0SH_001659 [Vibrio parahaemolyticus]|nr:hypothetical protein [Vibrio parahaemolyticus]WLI87151.1 hypothetical protein Q7W79_15065 [Vibrio parahaemolyticus]